jgi:hypothetical protein
MATDLEPGALPGTQEWAVERSETPVAWRHQGVEAGVSAGEGFASSSLVLNSLLSFPASVTRSY